LAGSEFSFYILPARRDQYKCELWFYLHKKELFENVLNLNLENGGQILVFDLDHTLVEQEYRGDASTPQQCPPLQCKTCLDASAAAAAAAAGGIGGGRAKRNTCSHGDLEKVRDCFQYDAHSYCKIHVRPGWGGMKTWLQKVGWQIYVRTYASGRCVGDGISTGMKVWQHLDVEDSLKVMQQKRINSQPPSHGKKSLAGDYQFAWQVPFTVILDDVHNASGGLEEIWDKKDHTNVSIVAAYKPSSHEPKWKRFDRANEVDRLTHHRYGILVNARAKFKKQFEATVKEIRTTARSQADTKPWHYFVTSEAKAFDAGLRASRSPARSPPPRPPPRPHFFTERLFCNGDFTSKHESRELEKFNHGLKTVSWTMNLCTDCSCSHLLALSVVLCSLEQQLLGVRHFFLNTPLFVLSLLYQRVVFVVDVNAFYDDIYPRNKTRSTTAENGAEDFKWFDKLKDNYGNIWVR
jgi:hypothetical protein